MADESTPSSQAQEQLREFRRIVANAVGELRSNQVRDTFSAITLEELMDQHIELLQGTSDPVRPSRLQRVKRVKQELDDSIEAMKGTPVEAFRRHDPETDVNTSPTTDDGG